MRRVYQLVVLAYFLSIGFAGVKCAMGSLEADQTVDASASLWNSKLEAMPPAWKPRSMKEHPDLYYLLFDRYASPESLKRFFGFDDGEFYDELEKRGFI